MNHTPVPAPSLPASSTPLSPRHELFAQQLALGHTRAAAYRLAFLSSVGDRRACALGYRLAHRPEVAARVQEILQRAADSVHFTLAQRLTLLRDIILTPIGQVHPQSPLCRSYRHTTTQYPSKSTRPGRATRRSGRTRTTTTVRMPDKLSALLLYSRLAGDLPPQTPEGLRPQ